MDIKLKDRTPVQKNYVAVPRPLYPEVKAYIEDLLNKNFIRRSTSSYSSPVVCVRKKDQSLYLCVDYRELNKKSQVDRHPIPRIQETLDNLGGSSWFSVLIMVKATIKGFLKSKINLLLPLSRHGDCMSRFGSHLGYVMHQSPSSVSWKHVPGIYEMTYVYYLDDIIVLSKYFDEHIEHLRKVLQRLKHTVSS